MSAEQTPTLERRERSSRVRAAAVAALGWLLNLWLESGVTQAAPPAGGLPPCKVPLAG